MAITYDWIISNLTINETEGELKDVIKKFIWDLEGTDGKYRAVAPSGGKWINFGDADPNNFKPFNQFTKSEFDTFLNNNIANIQDLKNEIDARIEKYKQEDLSTKTPPWLS